MTKGLIEKPSDASSKLVQKALADQRSVIETYLFEYCEKNNIPESELRGRLGIVSCTEDRYIGVVNCTEPDQNPYRGENRKKRSKGSMYLYSVPRTLRKIIPKLILL